MKLMLAKIWKRLNLPKHTQLFIMRFVNDEFLVGVTGVILNKDNEILLFKHTYRQTPWSLPGGYLKQGEHPKDGIIREIFEETHLKVKIEKIIRTSPDPTSARLDICCYGTFISGKFHPSAEVSKYGFFSYDKLPHIGKRQKQLILRTIEQEKGYELEKKSWLTYFPNPFKKMTRQNQLQTIKNKVFSPHEPKK
jgi:ADP-ribose pyrophosphatase YjhB (NUDIX family)